MSRSFRDQDDDDDDEGDEDEEFTFLEACQDGDEDAIYDVIQDGVTDTHLNERDKNGRTGFSYVCSSGFLPILELLISLEDLDPNLPDNDGNTPLIFASQAGHDEVVNFLLQNYTNLRLDHSNRIGLTALIKASIQGRTKCAKLLLFAGANPNKQDKRRGLKAEQWARFCGRASCSDAISRYVNSKKYFFKKTFILPRERSNSVPDLRVKHADGKCAGRKSGWLARHFSFKRKKAAHRDDNAAPLTAGPLESRCISTPQLDSEGGEFGERGVSPEASARRPSCVDGTTLPLNLERYRTRGGVAGSRGGGAYISARQLAAASSSSGAAGGGGGAEECFRYPTPPRILETDYDLDKLTAIGVG